MVDLTAMGNSHRFFCNRACEYFPCHGSPNSDEFNCLFCFCPLYPLGGACGGNFRFVAEGVKDCSECHWPHVPEHYDIIVARLSAFMPAG